MSESGPLKRISRRWNSRLFLKAVAWFLVILAFGWSISSLFGYTTLVMGTATILALILVLVEKRRSPKQADVVRLINEQFQSTEYSTELIFDSGTKGITAIQRERVLKILSQELPKFRYPIVWKDVLWTSTVMIIVFGGLWFSRTVDQPISEVENVSASSPLKTIAVASDSVFLEKTSVVINPPKYTGLGQKTLLDLDVSAPAQSKLSWSLKFSGIPKAVWLRFNSGDSLPLKGKGNDWWLSRRPLQNELYTVNFVNQNGTTVSSKYHEVQLVQDEPPAIAVEGIPQFQRLDYRKGLSLEMQVKITDDYALTDGFLIATITKGSGESVKFREQKVPFKKEVKGSAFSAKVILNLDGFDMEPGNELYFYGSAFDNKEPEKQQARTETFFYILEDTTEIAFSLQGALGIDLMPDYFRSQLQIILDTEKLLREKDQLTEYEFNSESNSLGFDQKQLRLKYGQFIGEEEDSGLELEQEDVPQPDVSGEGVLDEFGHNTDKENEEGQWMDRGTEHDHEEDHTQEDNPLEAFMHEHEDEETSSFYTQTLKSKLRAALNEMWSAELYLRLYSPEESLPYQYKAQKLLKEIRNHARIYVQRIGFDPPPVNEAESRLTGKLKELNDRPFAQSTDSEVEYPAIREAIVVMDQLDELSPWSSEVKEILQRAGDELAGLAIEFPGKYLSTLNDLRNILELEKLSNDDSGKITAIRRTMEKALPDENEVPSPTNRPNSEMTKLFIENLLRSSGK